MLPFKEIIYVTPMVHDEECIIAADIGGTNSNFGIFSLKSGKPDPILSIHFKSQQIKEFTLLIKDLCHYLSKTYGITINKACFAIAGIKPKQGSPGKPTNLTFLIDTAEIKKQTGITCTPIVNDFEIIEYGLKRIKKQDIVLVNKGKIQKHGTKAIIGAGTGLGKCILQWHDKNNRYMPIASEGGHADFAAQTQLELDLIHFIQQKDGHTYPVSWEDVLSGDGIKNIYAFFQKQDKQVADPSTGPHPDEIFESRTHNENSMLTFKLYTKLYARSIKNFALETVALGGVYVAGGIAAKNLPLFKSELFLRELTNCRKHESLLKEVPVFVITDYNVSLFGAAEYLTFEGICP